MVWPLSLGTGARPTRLAARARTETPELRRLDDEHVRGHLADAWNARQDVEPLAQVRVCVAQRFEVFVDRFGLAVDLAQPLSELTLDEGRDGDGLAVEGCDAVLDECVAGVDEFPQGLDRLAGGGARLEVENCAHAGKHKGVAPVSLGEFSCGLGEASGLTGIDLDPRQAGLDERPLQQAMVGPCRLENDSGDIEPFKPFDEGAMAFRIVRDAKAVAVRMDRPRRECLSKCRRRRFVLLLTPSFSQSLSCLRGLTPGVRSGRREKRGVVKLQVSPFRLARLRPIPSRRRSVSQTGQRRPILPDQTGKQ